MKTAIIENTDTNVSRLSFGTASLHHIFSSSHRRRLLDIAADVGITHFDTSPYYGYGLAEHDLGGFLSGRRDRFTITTKFGLYIAGREAQSGLSVRVKKIFGRIYKPYSKPVVDWTVSRAKASLGASLKRLGSDYVDFLFLHEPSPEMVGSDELLRWLEIEKMRGRIRNWGLAGEPSRLEPWLRNRHPLSLVLQTRDDLVGKPADFILESNQKMQFTYGYMSSLPRNISNGNVHGMLDKVAMRNNTGSVIISTRRSSRLKQIAFSFQ